MITQSRAGPLTVENRTLVQRGEAAAAAANTGYIAIYDRSGRRKCVLLDGLPASVTSTVPHGRTVYIQIGARDLVLPGPVSGTEVPNPNPSSPILASVLVLSLPCPCDELDCGFTITQADHEKLAQKQRLTLTNADGLNATLRMLVKLPNYTPAPVPGVPNAVKGSNPFGMLERGGSLYMSDAAQNAAGRPDAPDPGHRRPAMGRCRQRGLDRRAAQTA